jgi:BMFP domain-containing protein YqiC
MQNQSSVFDDLARVMTGAMGVAQGLGEEAKAFLRSQADLVSRDEFEAVKQLAAEARAEVEDLTARLAALEARLAAKD